MERWLRTKDNRHGEWAVSDVELGYRICHFNHDHHGGAHLHHPLLAPAGRAVGVETAREAETLMRMYRQKHASFEPRRFQEVMKAWRSASNND